MKLFTRLLLLFLLVAVLPLALLGYLNLQSDEEALRHEALARLSGLADKKANQVQSYLAERVESARLLARSPKLIEEMALLLEAYHNRAGMRYAGEDKFMREYLQRYVDKFENLYDIILIAPDGEVIYTQKHEADFATSLISGTYRDSQLALAFKTTRMTLEPMISDYGIYAPSQQPALFISVPVMAGGRFVGVLAVQLSNQLLYRVATDATGLGHSGEAVFAERDGDDMLFTMPLKYHDDAALKLKVSIGSGSAIPMLNALAGSTGSGVYPDYRGVSVVAAWRYLPELDWGMVVKMDAEEVFASVNIQRIVMLETLLGMLLFIGFGRILFRSSDHGAAGTYGTDSRRGGERQPE